jgi:hypothetical protein
MLRVSLGVNPVPKGGRSPNVRIGEFRLSGGSGDDVSIISGKYSIDKE